ITPRDTPPSHLRGIDSEDYRSRRVPLHCFTRLAFRPLWQGTVEPQPPLRDWFITALTSRSIQLLHRGHDSCLMRLTSSFCAIWSLSPHLAQSIEVPLVSPFVRWMTGTPIHFALYSTCL